MSHLIAFFTGESSAIASVVWPLMLGAFLALIIAHFNKRTVGILVKRLLKEEASSPDSAKSLSELGLNKKRYLNYALRPSSTLRSMVFFTEKDENGVEKLYIPDDKAYRAESQYKPDGSSLLTVFVTFFVFIAVGLLLVTFVPDIVGFATSVF